ncbi:protein kinase domain-containing protein [Dactylosporangium sp. CA-092794]|uniref:protein kinase domain-containing protein n=1 Tax=Dactylosporangium sp. CA-092794 TaxID=3239929 RepID=UPI003D92ADBF
MIGVGTVLAGRYRIEQHIASGGMGDVWQGFDQVLDRTVAVKCLRAPSDEPSFVDRFWAEARTMATISHPGVVDVYDFGDDPATGVYLVMKYIDGESLAHTLARDERLGTEATMRLVAEAAEALHAAHEKGVTHRDVKPGNLLLRPDGSTMLTDFGIARSAAVNQQTAAGLLLGTASYMAPERTAGEPATARSDIYSLGVVAYRCLAGHLPFEGENLLQIALRHANDDPPPLPADVPPAVREVVTRAMAKDPAARWPSGEALAAAARTAMTAPPARRRSILGGRGGLLVAGAAALVIAIVVTTVVLLGRGSDPPPPDPVALPDATHPAEVAGLTGITPVPGASSPAPVAGPASATAAAGATTPARTAGTALPEAPAKLTATPVSATAIRLQWTDNSANETGFTLINGSTSRTVGANTTAYTWDGLTPDTYMCFKVRAYNASGASAYFPAAQSDWVCATSQPGTGPTPPTNLTATPAGPTAIRLQWTDNSANETGFTVINGSTSRTVGANTTAYTWDGLAPNTYMCFKVRAYNAAGVSPYYPAAQQDWVCLTTPAA